MTNEVGRSMVETLGMLAIMGVLSVVGLAGYNSAMDKSKANTLIQEAQKRAVIVAGQIGFNNQTASLSEFSPYNTTSSGTFGDVITTGLTGQFGIQVSGVSKSICQNILNTIGDTTPIRRLSKVETPTTPITSCDEDNAFLFIYNNDMQGVGSDTEYAIDDSSCKSVCGKFNPESHLCDESDCAIPTNTCTTNTDCNTENECMVCDTETSQCKNGCERVQYLESTGSQYIDTGIVGVNDLVFEIEMACPTYVNGSVMFGVVGADQYTSQRSLMYDNNLGMQRGEYGARRVEIPYDNKFHTYYLSNSVARIDSLSKSSSNLRGTTDRTFFLFGFKNAGGTIGYAKIQIKSAKFWIDGLIADFVPVLSPETSEYAGKACMLNKVKKDGKLKLYCDANGGTFKTNKDN